MKLLLTLVFILTFSTNAFSCFNPEDCYLRGDEDKLNAFILEAIETKINLNSDAIHDIDYLKFEEHFTVDASSFAVQFGRRVFTLELEDATNGEGFYIYLHNAVKNTKYDGEYELKWLKGAKLLGGQPVYYCEEGTGSWMGDPSCGGESSQVLSVGI